MARLAASTDFDPRHAGAVHSRALVPLVLALIAATALGVAGCRRRAPRVSAPPPTAGYAVAVSATGAAPDFISQAMALRAQQFAYDMVPSSYLEHGYLYEGQEEQFSTVFETGRCYRIIAVGSPTMIDLDLFIYDENWNLIDQDTATDNQPVLGMGANMMCPRWTGPFFVTARAYRGFGEYGIQIFRTP